MLATTVFMDTPGPAFSSKRNPSNNMEFVPVSVAAKELANPAKLFAPAHETSLKQNRDLCRKKKKLKAGGIKSRHKLLLQDADVKRWHDNLARGSRNTAAVRLRRLGLFCEQNKTTPTGLVSIGRKDAKAAEDILLDYTSHMESAGKAPGYIDNTRKAVKSWLEFNYIELKRRIKIKNSDISVTLQDEKVPEKKELEAILNAASPRARTAISFVAFAGLRPQSLGNDIGCDGIRLSDIPDLIIEDDGSKLHFQTIPAKVVVRPSLSKAGHRYFTFLSKQGCEYLLGYLGQRRSHGEILLPESPVITLSRGYDLKRTQNENAKKSAFITTPSIRDDIRAALRVAIKERPYVLRSYFDTQLLLAESHGKIAHDFRVFFMGHTGSMEARYTTNKGRLPDSLVDEMRRTFTQSEEYLSTGQDDGNKERNKKEILLEMWKEQAQLYGIDPMKIRIEKQRMEPNQKTTLEPFDPTDEEIDAIKATIQSMMRKITDQTHHQTEGKKAYESKLVDNEDELVSCIQNGWEVVKELNSGKVLLRRTISNDWVWTDSNHFLLNNVSRTMNTH